MSMIQSNGRDFPEAGIKPAVELLSRPPLLGALLSRAETFWPLLWVKRVHNHLRTSSPAMENDVFRYLGYTSESRVLGTLP